MRPIIDRLAGTRRVIAVDFQGHGRTADIDRPITCEHMADDVAALPELAILPGTTHVGVMERTDLLGPMISAFFDKTIG